MPSLNRRAFLAGSSAALTAASGCTILNSSGGDSDPHWVKVYLGDRDETHNVTITITDQDGTTVPEQGNPTLGRELDNDFDGLIDEFPPQ